MRFPGTVNPRVFLFAAALFAAVASPLAAQQASVPAPVAQAGATPVSAPTTPLPGPRVRAEFRPAEAIIKDSRVSPLQEGERHTITISTLALVLVVVILVLLIAR